MTGASLDEQALIKGLENAKCGEFVERSSDDTITIILNENEYVYDVIHVNEFSSDRKMMSVLVRDRIDGKAYVLAKGAESQIMHRLTEQSERG